MSAERGYNQYDGYGSSGETEIKYTRKNSGLAKQSPSQQHPTPPASPKRTNTRSYRDSEGNTVEEAVDSGNTNIRTHYDWDDDTKAEKKSSGKKSSGTKSSGTKTYTNKDGDLVEEADSDAETGIRAHYDWDKDEKKSNVKVRKNKDGDYEQTYDGDGEPAVRTHDYSNDEENNRKLFGKNAPKPPSRTNTASRDHVVEHKGDQPPPLRTHDYSDENEINERLFGKGAKNADPSDHVQAHTGSELPAVRTHDHSNQDEINERLFGKGAKNAEH